MKIVNQHSPATQPLPASTKEFLFFKPRSAVSPVSSTLNERHLKTLLRAIRLAWLDIETYPYVKSAPFIAAHFLDEDEITVKLIEILNNKLLQGSIPGFRSAWFQDVVRDAKQTTATVQSFDQMPDMTFRMVMHSPNEDRSESGLFVECKVVSKSSGCAEYVSQGLVRFVSGRYAPQMGIGLMLAYATSQFHQVSAELTGYFQVATKPDSVICKADILQSDLDSACFATFHQRPAPCDPNFCALHLWVVRNGIT